MTTWTWPDSTVTRVIDGDSLEAEVKRGMDFGFHITIVGVAKVKMRLNRINAAPAKTDAGKAATAYVTELLAASVLIQTVGPYKFGDEWMAEITLPDGRNVSDVMVSEGHAVYWDGTGPRPGG